MSTLVKEVTVTKEISEVFEAVAAIVADVKEGKSITEISAENWAGLVEAVEGWDKFDDEFKGEHFGSTVAYGAGLIVDALRTKEAE